MSPQAPPEQATPRMISQGEGPEMTEAQENIVPEPVRTERTAEFVP